MQKDFWDLDQSLMDKEKIALKAKEHFSDEFIENYSEWKKRIQIMNDTIKAHLPDIPEEEFKPMEFDEFCQSILGAIDGIINKFGRFYTTDIPLMTTELGNSYAEKQLEAWNKKTYSVDGILNAVKKLHGSN
jgi:hypothetical protein